MTAFFSAIFASMLPKLLEYLWSKGSQTLKEQLAKQALKDYIDHIQADYKKVQDEFETLKLTNKITEQELEKIRREKIRLEEKLLNS